MANLLNKVASQETLLRAWNSIRHKPNSRGSDSETIAQFGENLIPNLRLIGKELRDRQYVFKPLLAHAIEKSGGGKRILRIAAVRDRVVQKAIQLVIEPRLEKRYKLNSEVSFAYLTNKSVLKAVKRFRDLYLSGFGWVYVADLKDFFGTIPTKKLIEDYLTPVIKNPHLCSLITEAINTDIKNLEEMRRLGLQDNCISEEIGIGQGVILSPLFSNLYLHSLDQSMIRSNFEMVRFADDFVVMCRTESDAHDAERLARRILEGDLKLELHPLGGTKSKIEKFKHLEFLGVRFDCDRVFPGTKRLDKMNKLLGDLQRRPGSGTFLERLNFLRDLSAYWAADFYCMDMEPKIYSVLDHGLAFCFLKLMEANGFVPKKRPYDPQRLEKLGIPTFTQRLKSTRHNKLKDFGEFYS